MKPPGKFAAFGSAALAAASVATWVGVSRQQPPSRTYAAPPDAGGVTICVGADSVLRAAGPGSACPAGSTKLSVAAPGKKVSDPFNCVNCDPWQPPAPGPTPKTRQSDRLAKLEERLGKLEAAPIFEVIDKEENVILRIARDKLVLFNSGGTAVAGVRATAGGGFFMAKSTDGGLVAALGTSGANAGVRITEGDVPRFDVGKQEGGANYSLRAPSNIDGAIAGIGESKAGTGAMLVGDRTGRVKASLTLGDDKGMVGIFNTKSAAVLAITQGATGGGLLAIGDAASTGMVKAGVKEDRYGIVMTGPGAGFPFVPSSGLPGSSILGCAGGGSCYAY